MNSAVTNAQASAQLKGRQEDHGEQRLSSVLIKLNFPAFLHIRHILLYDWVNEDICHSDDTTEASSSPILLARISLSSRGRLCSGL